MSKTPSPAIPFLYYREYFRVVATAYVTEDGLFKEKPENVTTPIIEIPVVYRVCVSTAGGELQIIDFANPPMMDKDKQVGGPVTLDGNDWFVEPGAGTTATECVTEYSQLATASFKATAGFMYALAAKAEGIAPTTP